MAPKSAPLVLFCGKNQNFPRKILELLPNFAKRVKPSITEFTHTKNHSIFRSTSLSMKIAHPRWKSPVTPPHHDLKTAAESVPDRRSRGKNRIVHEISRRTEAAQVQSARPGQSGAKWWTPRLLVDANVTCQKGEFFLQFFETSRKLLQGAQSPCLQHLHAPTITPVRRRNPSL